uniref:Reverse transcriptase Ty1/copia-type domain-containing protein n=1 Tax=Tanacetum cinerariifolium TaxID=118510 RepID=A0A6L2MQ96_TANCI|nr:hypothetical protein [Tanacetum cinerariifolium]
MLAEAQESAQILDEDPLAFIADLGIPDGQAAQTTIPNTTAFQTKDLDAYDFEFDDVSKAKAVLMANLSNYGYVISTKAQRIRTTFYDGSVISSQHAITPMIDDEETLILEEILVNVLFYNKNCLLKKLSGYKLHTLILTNLLVHLSKLRLLRKFLSHPPSVVSPVQVTATRRAVDLVDSPVSTSIDQDAPSTNPSRLVSTRKQLQTDAMWCYFDAFLTSVETENYKEAMLKPSLIDAMQEEIYEFERLQMSMMGKMTFFRITNSSKSRGIFINQSNYALDIIKKYGMLSSDPVDTHMVDKSKLDKDQQGKLVDPTHYRVKRIFRYLKGTIDMGLWYSKDSCITITAYANADYAGCQDTRQSASGSAQFLGDKLTMGFNKIPLYYDKNSAITLRCNNVQRSRSKHIDVRYNFIKEQVENGVVELYFVRIEYQLADIFTKALP